MSIFFDTSQDRFISNNWFILAIHVCDEQRKIMCELILDQIVFLVVLIHAVIDGGWLVVGILISGLSSNKYYLSCIIFTNMV